MFTLAGYDVHTQLYESEHSRIYRAIRAADACPVILKCLNHDQPPPEQRARFQWEYALTQRVNTACVIKTYALDPSKHQEGTMTENTVLIEKRETLKHQFATGMYKTLLSRLLEHIGNMIQKSLQDLFLFHFGRIITR